MRPLLSLCAATAIALCAAPAAAVVPDASTLVGTWTDPDGGEYTISLNDGRPVLSEARYGTEPMTVMQSRWGDSTLEFSVLLKSQGVQITYKVLSVDKDGLDTVWWSNRGDGGRERLVKAAPGKDPTALLGVWEDRSVKTRYWIEAIDDVPTLIGGVDARGVPKMVTERSTQGSVAIWTVMVPKTGYTLTYRCEPGARETELACTWQNVAPDGTRRDGQEVLRRMVAP